MFWSPNKINEFSICFGLEYGREFLYVLELAGRVQADMGEVDRG